MKVLYVNSVYKEGSTGRIVYNICKHMEAIGNDVYVCYGRGKKADKENISRISSPIEVYIHVIMARLTGIEGVYSYPATRRLISIIKREKPDIIHLHNLHGYYLDYFHLIDVISKMNCKVVWTLHDELMYTGSCAYAFSCDKWKTECHNCPENSSYPKSLIFDFSREMFKKKKRRFENLKNVTFVTPSYWLKDRVRQSIIGKNNIETIHNGIDIDGVFFPRDKVQIKGINSDEKIVLTVTDDVNCERKGIRYTLQLAKMYLGEKVKFVIVGGSVADCNLSNVVFIEKTDSADDLAAYYSTADVFIITSQCDNYPTVCLEALACGTPIIGFDSGGIKEVCDSNEISTFVKLNDLVQMEEKIKKFLSQDREILRGKCRQFAEKKLGNDIMVDQYIKLYGALLEGN